MKYIVSMFADGRVDVEVEADSVSDAFLRANLANADMAKMEIVRSRPVNCSDENGNMLEDY